MLVNVKFALVGFDTFFSYKLGSEGKQPLLTPLLYGVSAWLKSESGTHNKLKLSRPGHVTVSCTGVEEDVTRYTHKKFEISPLTHNMIRVTGMNLCSYHTWKMM